MWFSLCPQASGSVSSEGGRNGSQIWNPTADFTGTVRSPETSEPASKHPAYRRGSVPESPSNGCARKFSSSISSITITSRKVTRSSSLPDTSRPIQSVMAMNDPGALSTPVPQQRKALVVKVTEQRTRITSTSHPLRTNPKDHNTDHKGYDHPVVLRKKTSIVKGQPDMTKPAQYRHSYTDGLYEADAIKHDCRSGVDTKANPVLLKQDFVSVQPGRNQWRSSSVQNRSSMSLHLNNPDGSRTSKEKYETPRRPLSCEAGLFNHTDPTFHNKSSPHPQKTNIHLVSPGKEEESGGFVSSRKTENRDGIIPDPVLGIKPLTLLKVPGTLESSGHSRAHARYGPRGVSLMYNRCVLSCEKERSFNWSWCVWDHVSCVLWVFGFVSHFHIFSFSHASLRMHNPFPARFQY